MVSKDTGVHHRSGLCAYLNPSRRWGCGVHTRYVLAAVFTPTEDEPEPPPIPPPPQAIGHTVVGATLSLPIPHRPGPDTTVEWEFLHIPAGDPVQVPGGCWETGEGGEGGGEEGGWVPNYLA